MGSGLPPERRGHSAGTLRVFSLLARYQDDAFEGGACAAER